MQVNSFYNEVLTLKEKVKDTVELDTIYAARLKLIRISLGNENIALLKRNEALKNVVVKLSSEPLDMPLLDPDSIEVSDFVDTFKQETLQHFNNILLVAHSAK
ncbi:hypothetical protein [Alteromonas gracilis]|uniref:hypothetical protein n=1 Tax=Alteromonas gracilis TaxID=1479524 RepID=UPI003736B2DF